MIIKKRIIKAVGAICFATMLMMPFASCDTTPSPAIKSIDTGSTWEIIETTSLSELTIAEGATIKAPEGYNVTMTIDSVGTAIEPGTYNGKIVLTVTEEIKIGGMAMGGMPGGEMPEGGAPGSAPGGGPPGGAPDGAPGGGPPGGAPGGTAGGDMLGSDPSRVSRPFKAAIYVENGRYIAEKSVAAAVSAGEVTDASAKDVKIVSNEPYFNGIILTGDSKASYSIINPAINLNENGGNDFSGLGMGIFITGKAEVNIEKANIVNRGANRNALYVAGESVVHVNDSYIETFNGTSKENITMSVPWVMGLSGNVRATNLGESGTIYYNNTHIKSQGWGCLSTDGVINSKLYATKCLIETVESGYGAFTLGNNVSTFSECTFNVTDIGLVSQDGSGVFTDGTVVNSGRFGAMYFGTDDYLTIEKGSVFNTKETVIQLKTPGHTVVVDNAQLNPGNGIILQVMPFDDPNLNREQSNNMGGTVPGSRKKGTSYDNVTFKNMNLNGDIINGDTALASLNVTFENATIMGAITTAIVKHAVGPNGEKVDMNHPELYKLIGSVTNTFCQTNEKYGLKVSLDKKSEWVIDETCYLTELIIAKDGSITAPRGYSVTMTVDGVKKAIGVGAYKGKIVLTVTKG